MSLLQQEPSIKQEGTDVIEDLPSVKKCFCSVCGFKFSKEKFLRNCFNCCKNIEKPDDRLGVDPTAVIKEEIDCTKLVDEQGTSKLTLDIKDEEVEFTDTSVTVYGQFIGAAKADKPETVFPCSEYGNAAAQSTHTGEEPFKDEEVEFIDTSVTVYGQFIDAAKADKPEKVFPCSEYGNAAAQSTHTGEEPFKCTLCDYSGAYSCSLQLRMRQHTGDKPFKCALWDCTSTQSKNLIQHKRTHTGAKTFKCFECAFSSVTSDTLVRHMRRHTGVEPLKCTLCDYTTAQNSNLMLHKRTHTGEKPFKCTLCDYTCAQSHYLLLHKRTHTGEKPFKCTVCDYASTCSGSVVRHMRTHTGEKPFKCTFCDHATTDRSSLILHIRMHTGEKPFKCNLCHYTCRQSNSLTQHKRKHTGEK